MKGFEDCPCLCFFFHAVWVDVEDCVYGKALGPLQFCLIGKWKTKPEPYPAAKEVEVWFRDAWRLNEDVMLAVLNEDLLLLEFDSPEKAKWVLESGRRSFKGGVLQLDRWSPESGCIRRKGLVQEAWIRVVRLPLHLWTPEILRKLGDACGGFVALDKDTEMKTEVKWARMMIKSAGKSRPSAVNILEGPRSFELQIWWEIPPWVTGVYPVSSRVEAKHPKEEEEGVARTVKRVGLPRPNNNDEGQREQDCGTKMGKRPGLVEADKVNSVSGVLMKLRGGAYAVGWGNKKARHCRLGEGLIQQAGPSVGPNVRARILPGLNGIEIPGPRPDISSSPNAQKDGRVLKKWLKMQQAGAHKVSTGGATSLDGLNGLDFPGPKQGGSSNCPRALKFGDRGNSGLKKGFKVARSGLKGVTSCSKEKRRLEDGGFRLGAEGSSDFW